ncbi:MAG: 6-phosphofructokinase [Firmicutes bacterium]|nr:6-phosphofructokinase [Bacillota bacterium]
MTMKMGNVIVGQSGGPTSVINSSLAGVFKTAKQLGAPVVYGMRNGIEGLLEERYIDMSEYIKGDLEIELLKRTPSAYLGSCRFKLPTYEKSPETYDRIIEVLRKLDVKHFFYIGGNDSMDTIKQLSEYAKVKNITDITFMGVPKTIDNDLAVTDHTPGYGSAAKYIGATVKEIIQDAYVQPINIVTVIEIMGRNAGWLAAASALAKGDDCPGADLIYLPESVFDIDKFVQKVKDIQKDKKQVVVCVSEGIKTADGKYVCESAATSTMVDSFGHKMLGGTASTLSTLLAGELGCKTRPIEFSTIQRCASHIGSLTDVTEAFLIGAVAVKAAAEGETGKVGVFERVSNKPYLVGTSIYDVNAIANVEKTVPKEWIIEDGTALSQEAIDYMSPLIQGEVYPYMVNGLPKHIRL